MNNPSETIILIVEDEGLIALWMMEFLEREGYRVLEPVPTGEEAVDRCGQDPRPDLVLIDVHLAGKIDGIETARMIRECNPIPVLILTAREDGMIGKRMNELAPEAASSNPLPARHCWERSPSFSSRIQDFSAEEQPGDSRERSGP